LIKFDKKCAVKRFVVILYSVCFYFVTLQSVIIIIIYLLSNHIKQ